MDCQSEETMPIALLAAGLSSRAHAPRASFGPSTCGAHCAARAGSTRCLEELLAAGALVHLTDDRGVTPIRTAASAKSLRSVHLLALAGATMPNLEVALDSQPPRANCLGLGNVMNSIFCRVMCVPCDVADAMATTHVPSHAAPTTN